jgi:hypothetical protein
MADYPASQIQSPDVGSTLGTIFGLKSKQLGLEQQRQALQGQAAQVQQEQQTAKQRQAVGQFYNNFKPADHVGADGTLDLDSALQDKNLEAAGDAKPAVIQSLLDVKKSQLGMKQQLASLNQGLVTQFGTTVGALANDPDVQSDSANGRAKVASAISAFGEQSPDAARIAQLYSPVTQHAPPGQLGKAVGAIQLQAQSASEQQRQQNPEGGLVDTGPSFQPTNRNPATGQVTAAGPPIQKGLGPTQQPGYIRSTAAAGQEGAKGASNDEDLYNQVTAAGTKAPQIKGLTQDIQKLADEVKTGTYTKALANKWASVSQFLGVSPSDTSPTTRRQLLGKYTQQLMLQQEASNGASTDAAQAHVEAAMPDPEHMDPEAIKAAARFVGGQADLASARARVANAQRQTNGGTSTGLRAVDSTFMQNADPRGFAYKDIPKGPERQAYLKEHFKSPQEVQDFLGKQAVADHFSGR